MPAKRSFMRPKCGSNLGRTSSSCRNLNMPVMLMLPLLLLLPILWSTKLCSLYPVQAGALTQRSEEQSAWDLIITRLLDGKLKT
ncbi:hypothetical protein Godav_004834 [Gossypium davidsonii]|uniref:Uncharacterized protein n=1 Tax=Gossypium davidsonii TaxID=34287 RepID=A0A7J8SMG8_GOSDV|nr:hypothetical protein [Gossypium davidsonii]